MTDKNPLIVGFDIETADADKLFTGGYRGPFVRLCGYVINDDEPVVTTDPEEMLRVLYRATVIYGHNVMGFDLPALARHCGADFPRLARRTIDTLVMARVLNPPFPRPKQGVPLDIQALRRRNLTPQDLRISYKLDTVAAQLGVEGKTDNIMALAAKHGGLDMIPVDDPEYVDYLKGDLVSNRAVYRKLGQIAKKRNLIDVIRREMRISAIQNRMYLAGFGADRDEVALQIELAEKQRADAYRLLHEKAGVPLPGSTITWWEPRQVRIPKTTKRGKRVRHLYEVLTGKPCPDVRPGGKWRSRLVGPSSLTTTEGRTAFEAALKQAGVVPEHIPFTAPTETNPEGKLALSKGALGEGNWLRGKVSVPGLLSRYPDNIQIRELCEAAIAVTSASGKAEEVMAWITDEDRVHARIGDIQASGRWAHVSPSITNIGKRGEVQKRQRAMFQARMGYRLVAIDLDQVDARAIAAHCQDPEYLKLAAPGVDLHYEVALRVFGSGSCNDCRSCGECRTRRKNTKAITHAWNYGQGPKGASALTGLPEEVTRQFDQGMKKAFPVLCSWRNEIRAKAERTGFVPSAWRRPLRVIPGQEYTQAPAQVGQSTTRDLLCDGLLRMDEETLSCLRLVIHDEIVLEIPEEKVEEISQRAMDAMTTEFKGVPITCGVSPAGKNWVDCYAED